MTEARIDELSRAGITYHEPMGIAAMNVVVETTDEGMVTKENAFVMGVHGKYLFVQERSLSDWHHATEPGQRSGQSGTNTTTAFTTPEVISVTGSFLDFDAEGETFEEALLEAGFLFDEVGNVLPEGE